MGRAWTHKIGVLEHLSETDYINARENLRFTAWEIDGLKMHDNENENVCGLVLPNSRSPFINSTNSQRPMNYLASTGEVGKIVITQMRWRHRRSRELRIYFDVFPGYDAQVIGPNPYVMIRETFGIKTLASIIPVDHKLSVPKLAVPIDCSNKQEVKETQYFQVEQAD